MVLKWLERYWPMSTIFLAVYVTMLLALFVLRSDFPLFLIWAQLPVYFLHQFEEYVFPGGFKEFFNTKVLGSPVAAEPLNARVSMWINVPIVYVAFPISAVLATTVSLTFGLWMAYFSVINALSHVVMFAKLGYNPGFIASLVLNIPVGIYTIAYLSAHDLVSPTVHIVSAGIGLTVQAALMIYGFGVLKPRLRTTASNAY
jgi:hypothetical protein